MRYWDQSYFYQALGILLNNYIKEFERAQEWDYVGKERDIKKMRVCRTLCERILQEDYYSPYREKSHKQMEERWAKAIVTDLPDGNKGFTFADEKVGIDWTRMDLKFDENMRKQDQALLFNTLNKNLDRWWW